MKLRILRNLPLLAVLAVAAFLLYIPSETMMALAIPPDSSEYSIGLVNLFEHGKFGFTLNGEWYPSRYSPWFSLSCLTPAYILSGGNVLCFNWAILGFALALLVLIAAWARKVGLGRWSPLVAALLIFLPDFVYYSRVVMTEIPYATLFAASALAFLRFVDRRREASVRLCLGVGALIAWGGMIRPTMLPMLLPFAVVVAFFSGHTWRWRFLRLFALALPAIGYEVANLSYNWAVFGTPMRSGYQYWMPVPCDYPGLLFSLRYVIENFREWMYMPVVYITLVFIAGTLAYAIATIAGCFGGRRANRNYLLLTAYLVFQLAILAALYFGYYWQDTRFFLAVTLCSVPLFLAAVWRVLDRLCGGWSKLAFIGVLGLCVIAFLYSPTRYYFTVFWRQYWLEKAKISASVLPEGSVVIQEGDPNVLDYFCFRRRQLEVLPFARRFDYEYHMVSMNSIRSVVAQPSDVMPLIRPELVSAGLCQLPFPETFQENPGQLHAVLAAGRRVFLEQESLRGESGWEPFQEALRENGLCSRYAGMWNSPGTSPNPIRHLYDRLVFGSEPDDALPEVQVVYHEILEEGAARAK